MYIVLITFLSLVAHAYECMYYDKVVPTVTVDVQYDSKKSLYSYSYTLSNGRDAEQNIESFLLRDIEREGMKNIENPSKWFGGNFRDTSFDWVTIEAVSPLPNWFDSDKHTFAPLAHSIKPGQTQRGFSFKSPNPPGTISYYAKGEGDLPTIANDGEYDAVLENCPGHKQGYFGVTAMGKTLGPVKANTQLIVEINIKPMSEEPVPFNPKAKGVLPVAILGSDEIKADDINPETVVFGPKEIKALKHSVEDVNKDGKKDLMLHFKSDQAGIRCGADFAVFVKGKLLDGRGIQGAQSITPVGCNEKENKKKKSKK